MFVRIELDDQDNLEKSIKQVRSGFKKVPQIYFPTKEVKGAKSFGFNFFKLDTLLDWSSISTWCDLDTELGDDPNTCTLIGTPKSITNITEHIDLIAKSIAGELEFLNTIRYEFPQGGGELELTLCNAGDQLEWSIDLSSIDANEPKALKAIKKIWGLASKKFPALKKANVSFEDDVTFEVSEQSSEIRETNSGIQLNFTGIAAIKSALKKSYELTGEINDFIKQPSIFISICVSAEDAAETAQKFLKKCPGGLHFDGRYLKTFHPDQVRKKFPKEGFWHLPIFSVQLGTPNQVTPVFLVQTPKERFLELDVFNDAMVKQLVKQLDTKGELKTWDGPTEERWGLDKLKKKK